MSVMQKDMANNDDMRMEWDPFSDEQVEGLFFPGAGRAEALEQLQHLLRYGSALTVLAGGPGLGKRMVVDRLLQQLDADLFDVADLKCEVLMSFENILSQLDDPWRSLRPFTQENYREMVPAVAAAADEESKTLLCIIRDAHLLAAELLQHLQALLTAAAGLPVKCLLVVGVGELEAAPALHGLVEAMPDCHVLYLDPFNLEQTEEYLRYRMHTAGLGQVSFNPAQINGIFSESRGIPARINKIAAELLLEALPAPKRIVPTTRLPWMHIGAVAVFVALLAGLFWSRQEAGVESAKSQNASIVLENAVQEVQPTPPAVNPYEQVAQVAAGAGPEAIPPTAEVATPEMSVNSSPALSNPEPRQSTDDSLQGTGQSTPEGKAEPVVKAPTEAVVEARVAVNPEPASSALVRESELPKARSAPAASADPRVTWLLSRPAEHYMLQLLGAQEEGTVTRFLSQYPSLKKVTYYKTSRKGKAWFVVVQGEYPDYAAARAAVETLPLPLQKQNPWIRKIEAIQQDLKNR